MIMKDFVSAIQEAIKKIKKEEIEQTNTYITILNKIYLFQLQSICTRYANSMAQVSFDMSNPFLKLQSDTHELKKRLRAAQLIGEKEPSISSRFADTIAAECTLAYNDLGQRQLSVLEGQKYFLVPKREYFPRNEVPLVNMTVITKLLLNDLVDLTPDSKEIDPAIYYASRRAKEEFSQFITRNFSTMTPVEVSPSEFGKCVAYFKALWQHIGGGKADYASSGYTEASTIHTLFAKYLIFADVAAKTDYINHDVDKILKHHAHGDTEVGANLRLIDYVANGPDAKAIRLNILIPKKNHGYPVYDLSHIKELFTNDELYNRLVLLKTLRIYVDDRKANQGYGWFVDNSKIPASNWAIDFVMRKTNLTNFEREIPENFKEAFSSGELVKFKVLILEAAKMTVDKKLELPVVHNKVA